MTFWFVIIFSEELLRQMVDSGWIPDAILQSNDIASVRMILMGIMLATLMIWRPQGLVGKKRRHKLTSDNQASEPVSIEATPGSPKQDPILKLTM